MKKAVVSIIFLLVLISGCANKHPEEIAAVRQQAQYDLLQTATHAQVAAEVAHWSAGAEDDGLLVSAMLLNAQNEVVKFENASILVEVEIRTANLSATLKSLPGRIIYSHSFPIQTWTDADAGSGHGLQIPFADINVSSNAQLTPADLSHSMPETPGFGILIIKFRLPDNRVLAAKLGPGDLVRTRPQ